MSMWLNKTDIDALEKDADSLREHGNKLLWELLFTPDDVTLARRKKQRSVGFAKLFGKENMKHLHSKIFSVTV